MISLEAASLLARAGNYLYEQIRYEEAEPFYQRALAIREQQLGPLHPDTATSLNNLAALYDSQGQYEQAEPLYQRALAICEQVLGPEHPHTIGSKREEWSDFRATSDQSARRVSSTTIDRLKNRSPSSFIHECSVNWYALKASCHSFLCLTLS